MFETKEDRCTRILGDYSIGKFRREMPFQMMVGCGRDSENEDAAQTRRPPSNSHCRNLTYDVGQDSAAPVAVRHEARRTGGEGE